MRHLSLGERWVREHGRVHVFDGGQGQGERHDSPQTVQAGGSQPFSQHGGREAGASLDAMLAGRDAQGGNPADVSRGLQKSARS